MEQSSNAMRHEWRPKHGVVFMVTLMVIIAIVMAMIIWSSVSAYAQGAALKNEPAFDAKGLMTMLLPAIWASIGPLAIAAITKGVNGVGAYIPRPLQVILSSILGAVGGALADGGITAAAATAASGAASQLYTQAHPATLLATKKPE